MSTTTMDTDDVLGRSRTHALDHTTLFQRLVATDGIAPTFARLGLGLVMMPHALQKALGMFGGHGLAGTYGHFTSHFHLPGPIALLAIVAEIFGAFALVFGAFTRIGAIAIAAVMAGAIVLAHAPMGFFMNWMGNKGGEGFEYHLLAIALALVCLVSGGGRFSIDRTMMKRHPALEGGMNPSFANVTEG